MNQVALSDLELQLVKHLVLGAVDTSKRMLTKICEAVVVNEVEVLPAKRMVLLAEMLSARLHDPTLISRCGCDE